MTGLKFLKAAPTRLETTPTRGDSKETLRVDREGGREGAGIIRGASLIKRGEALGHGFWIDETFLQQVEAATKAKEPNGLKARATHPGLSSDGFGTYLGRYHDPRIEGDKVLADLHFSQASNSTKENYREHTLDMAEHDPDMFGLSIVFMMDQKASQEHRNEHSTLEEIEDPYEPGETLTRRVFRSPDPLNKKNLPHARLAALYTADAVDEPAANDEGLSRNQDLKALFTQADDLMEYALGLNEVVPQGQYDVAPERVRGYVQRFLANRGLKIVDAEPKLLKAKLTKADINYLISQF